MTRKRFIKLLMGDGFSKRVAETSATIFRDEGVPYAVAWEEKKEYDAQKAAEEMREIMRLKKELAKAFCLPLGLFEQMSTFEPFAFEPIIF